MIRYVIVDLDGTLFNDHHRVRLAINNDFASYHEAFEGDTINDSLLENMHLYSQYPNNRIIILTGRPDAYRARTVAQLAAYDVPYHHLMMKPADKTTVPGSEWKVSVLQNKKILPAFHKGLCEIVAYDNDVDIVAAYQKQGIPAQLVQLYY